MSTAQEKLAEAREMLAKANAAIQELGDMEPEKIPSNVPGISITKAPPGGTTVLNPANGFQPFTPAQALKSAQETLDREQARQTAEENDAFLQSCERENMFTLASKPAKQLAESRVKERVAQEFSPQGILQYARKKVAR